MDKTKVVVCSWEYNKKGIYLDCYMEINHITDAKCLFAIELRTCFQGVDGGMGLFRIPVGWNRKQMEEAIKSCTEEQLEESKAYLKNSTYTISATDDVEKLKKYVAVEDLPLLIGIYPWLDKKIGEVLGC